MKPDETLAAGDEQLPIRGYRVLIRTNQEDDGSWNYRGCVVDHVVKRANGTVELWVERVEDDEV